MSRWIETIAVKDGELMHLADHQERMDRTVRDMLGIKNSIILEDVLRPPEKLIRGFIKCRLVYNDIIHDISWTSYSIKKIRSIALMKSDLLEYSTKKEDRSALEELVQNAGTDDIIITQRGNVTDTSYANLVFRQGNKWFTPSTPLLAGTRRNRLLKQGKIKERLIRIGDLKEFQGFKYINAMLDLEESPELPMQIIQVK